MLSGSRSSIVIGFTVLACLGPGAYVSNAQQPQPIAIDSFFPTAATRPVHGDQRGGSERGHATAERGVLTFCGRDGVQHCAGGNGRRGVTSRSTWLLTLRPEAERLCS
jgi:hypothetical protein